MARVNRIVAHVKFFLLNSCTLSRTEKSIWPSYAIFYGERDGNPWGIPQLSPPFWRRTSRHVRCLREELAAIPCGAFPAKLAGAEHGGFVGPCYQLRLPHDVRFVLVGQCEADPRPSSFAPGSHGVKCKLC